MSFFDVRKKYADYAIKVCGGTYRDRKIYVWGKKTFSGDGDTMGIFEHDPPKYLVWFGKVVPTERDTF